jgi:hypothetical protein
VQQGKLYNRALTNHRLYWSWFNFAAREELALTWRFGSLAREGRLVKRKGISRQERKTRKDLFFTSQPLLWSKTPIFIRENCPSNGGITGKPNY